AVVVAAACALYLILTTPYEMRFRFYSDAPGFALLQYLNRTTLGLTTNGARVLLLLLFAGTLAVLLGMRYVRRGAAVVAITVAAFVIAWNGAGELAAASSSN